MLLSCNTLANFKLALLKPVAPRIRLKASKLRYVVHQRADQVDWTAWSRLVAGRSVFLQKEYLEAMCRKGPEFRFTCFLNGDQLVGIAVFHIAEFDSSDITPNLEQGNKLVTALANAFKPSDGEGKLNILICGNAYSTGEHAFSFDPSVRPADAMNGLCKAVSAILNEEKKSGRKISGILVKDFYEPRFEYARELRKCGFRDFNVDHNMIMPILPEWKSFELYLDALNSKFRTKAKASIHRSSEVKIESWDARKIRENLPFISELYHAVYDRADFRLGKLKADQFVFMKEELGDDFIFRAYTFDGLLVGFATAFAHDHVLDAHLIGINYDLNKKLGIYSRMLYDYIELAIATQSTQLVFGRTAGEIKSAAGALPVDLKCCIRHPGRISNVLLTLLFSYVRPSEFALRQPYKKETLASIAEHFSHLRVGPSILSNL